MPPNLLLPEAEEFGLMAARETPQVVTRFAPSPNGLLHLGHAYAAIAAHDFARAAKGRFLLRIEDIDGNRSRQQHVAAILADLGWLGLAWDAEPIFQSARIAGYRAALNKLQARGLAYRCRCSRAEIAQAIKEHPVCHGPDGPVYPGTCRDRQIGEEKPFCWRLDMQKAVAVAGETGWLDMEAGAQEGDPALFGDIVLWRKDAPASYHLAATLDDAADGITHVVRGKDLFAYSALHRLLQKLLDLPQPTYWHHQLILDEAGEKLAKSRKSAALSRLRLAGENGLELASRFRKGEVVLGTPPSVA